MKPLYVIAALTILAACDKPAAPVEQATPVAEAPATPVADALTPAGWGGVKIGMTNDQAAAALNGVRPDTQVHDADWSACHILRPLSPDGVWLMVEEDRVTRVSADSPTSGLKTEKGIAVGDDPAAVRAAYPTGLIETPHKYEAAPAAYLTYWIKPGEQGVRYTIGSDGKVAEISVGGASIEYVEGCS